MKLFHNIFYSFPVQLLLLNLKKNIFIVFIWFLLFGILLSDFGLKLGIPYLFLDPEYLGKTDFNSLFLIGIFTGLFIGAFDIAIYVLDSHKFVFLAYSKRPFINFCYNNALLPTAYVIVYIYKFAQFQLFNAGVRLDVVIINSLAYILGFSSIITIMFIYFNITNINWFKMLARNIDKKLIRQKFNRGIVMGKVLTKNDLKDRVDNYLSFPFKIKHVDRIIPFRKTDLLQVFNQNHLNAILFQTAMFLIVIMLIVGSHINYFQIPAGCSMLLLFTILVMSLGFIYYWFKKWYVIGLLGMLLIINFIFGSSYLKKGHQLQSLDYSKKVKYDSESLIKYYDQLNVSGDSLRTVSILNNWRAKFPAKAKPKMVLICVSGGGHRQATWSYRVMQALDKKFSNKFMKNVVLITGASGGMIGASYYRELYLRSQTNPTIDLQNRKYFHQLSQDALNPIALKMLIQDPISKIVPFIDLEDRGIAFEKQFNANTDYILNKPISFYRVPEQNAQIPMVIMSPAIINNSKKMYFSAQPVSYMIEKGTSGKKLNGVEFTSYFRDNILDTINYLTCLRINSSFPYISPLVSMPTEPEIKVMDAGISDNFGIKDAIRFTKVFSQWINKNTSGVVLITIRDPANERQHTSKNGILNELFDPIGSIYDNIFNTQDIGNEELMNYSRQWINKLDVVYFTYYLAEESQYQTKASLSWHLTFPEKQSIYHSINNPENIRALNQLELLLSDQSRLVND